MNTANEKIIQFGEGGFLRGFADWMIQKMTDVGRHLINEIERKKVK